MSLTATLGTDLPGGNVQAEQKVFRAWGTVAATGSYAAGGVALTFAGVVPFPNTNPFQVRISGSAGYEYRYVKSTGKVKVFQSAPGGGVIAYAESDIKGSTSVNIGIASGALPVNGALLSTLAAANNTTAFTIALQPEIGRNISISLKNTVAGASTGNAVDMVIVGTYLGVAQTETISFTALELTSTAQNEVATKFGSKPFDHITSITPSAAQPASWQHGCGPGSRIALPRPLLTPAEADVLKLTKNAADLVVTGLVDTTNSTVNFGALADGDDVSVEYNSAAFPAGELAAAAFPAGVTGDTISFEAVFPKY